MRTVSIAYLKSLYNNYPHKISENICIEGVLISNDYAGNFYKMVVLEDSSGGIVLKIDLTNIFLHYNTGRKYKVRCQGLTLGSYGGTLQLGSESTDMEYQVGMIPIEKIRLYISTTPISNEEYPLQPRILEINQLSQRYVSCWVGFNSAQFIDAEMGLAWTQDSVNTDRHLMNNQGDTLIVRTSRHANFASQILPLGSLHIEGVLGYFNKEYQLLLTSLYYTVPQNTRF